MAELITGDNSKGIKYVGELALRISRYDSYRLFTLYENVSERKVMNISGNQKYYLVFRFPKKEIRIPEYDPKGFFEVDKVNGCILFKITKKNAEDILGTKTNGEKIFHIVRVFEERDIYGRLVNITDEVEVYNGKWGDDDDFNAYSTSNKVDMLTKALAAQIDKNAKLMDEYNDLFKTYSDEIKKNSDLEKEIEALRSERDSLQEALNEYLGDTYDGTLLSTDTKYIAFESTLDNISFTEDQYNDVLNSLMTTGEVDLRDIDVDSPRIDLDLKVYDSEVSDLKITVLKNDITIGSAVYNQGIHKTIDAESGDVFKFVCTGIPGLTYAKSLNLTFSAANEVYEKAVTIKKPLSSTINSSDVKLEVADIDTPTLDINGGVLNNPVIDIEGVGELPSISIDSITSTVTATISYDDILDVEGNIGTLYCHI